MDNVIQTHALWCLWMNGLRLKWLPGPNPSWCHEQSQRGLVVCFFHPSPRKILALLLLLLLNPVFLSLRTQTASPFPLLLLLLLLPLLLTIGRVLLLPLPLLMRSVKNQGFNRRRHSRKHSLVSQAPRSHSVLVSPRVKLNPLPSARTSALSSAAHQRTTAV